MEEIHTQVGSAWESTPYLLLIQGLDNTGFDPFFMVFDIGFFFFSREIRLEEATWSFSVSLILGEIMKSWNDLGWKGP